MSDALTYQKSGVNPARASEILAHFAGHLRTRPKDPALLSGIGPYASCYSLKSLVSGMEDPVLVTCCDGVGTKAKLALEWGAIDGLGQDLVAMNINDLLCVGARPLLFLDYYACGKLEENQLLPLLKSIQNGCELAECSLAGGETAEMPGVYAGEDFDLAGFAVGMVDREKTLGPERVKVGDRLIAIESSGAHSNGYSLLRKIVERSGINKDARTPFDSRTWKECLLAPTLIYTKALKNHFSRVHALAHITGGGLFENLPRVLPSGARAVVQAKAWPLPPLFAWMQEQAAVDLREMLSTFNCGVGMIAIVSKDQVDAFCQALAKEKLRAWEIGAVEAGETGVDWH